LVYIVKFVYCFRFLATIYGMHFVWYHSWYKY